MCPVAVSGHTRVVERARSEQPAASRVMLAPDTTDERDAYVPLARDSETTS